MEASAERALIERCRRGNDDQAFAELVAAYKDVVYGLVWRLARDRSDVDDLAQEVFLKIYRGLPDFRGEARLSTWIYRIVANVCAQAKAPRRLEISLERGPGERPIDPGREDASFGEVELRDRLEKAIAQLPEHYRILIAGHHLEGVQYEALAESIGIPIGTVKTHLHRAKRRLRELLMGNGS
jgi:RNA polymerase sigma-70 factor, ECF subfamily